MKVTDCACFCSAKTRQAALEGLRSALASKLLSEFLLERRMTLTDSIERCLKKGTLPAPAAAPRPRGQERAGSPAP